MAGKEQKELWKDVDENERTRMGVGQEVIGPITLGSLA